VANVPFGTHLKIPIAEIKVAWGRLRNPGNVAAFAQRLRAGEVPPPIVVWHYRSTQYRFYCEDGRHRIFAAQAAGHRFIEAKILNGRIEFYHHPSGPLCHRIVPAEQARPAEIKPPRRPTKKPRYSGAK
jgi:hypothetical protein